ncbi:MAG: beta-galactosidase [Phycisphaeraceae bacterium]|nr:beta-galactosidase [Phycisphaeraceae bacterium]
MPTMTYDGRSFLLDGRRFWIVSGSIHYARVPAELWADRIHAARLAGLNTIETPVFWARHEPRPGQFDFEGDNDLRRFVELVGQAGLRCILRVGPFVGSGFDLGGLPPHLLALKNVDLRTHNAPFLDAASKFIGALADQVRDLQATAPGAGGDEGKPIILIQNETAWSCGKDTLAAQYLGELGRYLREAGFSVPVVNANNLWQSVEGEVDAWSGTEDLLAAMRQLGTVAPGQPRLVMSLPTGTLDVWGRAPQARTPGHLLQRRMGEVLAGGGQFNLTPFHGGTNFGFTAGRHPEIADAYIASSNDRGAPLGETGGINPCFGPMRRLATFASRFARTLAHAEIESAPVIAAPNARAMGGGTVDGGGFAVAAVRGSHGSVAFVFDRDPMAAESGTIRTMELLLGDGSSLPVALGKQSVGWVTLDIHMGGRSVLNYSTLNCLGYQGTVLVCFGPAGAPGVVSINGAPIDLDVPTGDAPLVQEHEGTTIVVVNEDTADRTFITDEAVFVGVDATDSAGQPIGAKGRDATRIDAATGASKHLGADRSASRATPPTIDDWALAQMGEYTGGSSARFASIDGPGDLTRLGSPYGYGWYRAVIKSGAAKRVRAMFPESADRLHLWGDGHALGAVGYAAAEDVSLALKRTTTLVVLAENLGRLAGGSGMGEAKGLYGPVWGTTPIKLPKPKIVAGEPIDLLAFKSPLWEVREGDTSEPDRLTWVVAHRRKTGLIVRIDPLPARAVLIVNEKPVRFIGRSGTTRLVLDQDQLSRGNNTIQLSFLSEGLDIDIDALTKVASGSLHLHEAAADIGAKAEWAFAKWEAPAPSAFAAATKAAMSSTTGPTWWRASFRTKDRETPLLLELPGMAKGQIYINGRHLGRYWLTGPAGWQPAQDRWYVPAPWLREDGDNELVLFDEEGGNPSKCRLVLDDRPSPIRA